MSSFKLEEVKNSKGVVVLIHGFNLNPEKLQDFIDFFHGHDFDTLNVTLKGHDGLEESMEKASAEVWMEDTRLAFDKAFSLSKKKKVPFYFWGYSTGALTGQLIQLEKEYNVVLQFLFAPALGMRDYIKAGRMLTKIGLPKSLFPEVNYKNYRAINYMPPNGYKAFFDLLDEWIKSPRKKERDKKTLTFARKEDEIVSYKKLQRLLKDEYFDKWEIQTVAKNPKFPMQHVMVDQESLGDHWYPIIDKMNTFIKFSKL